MDTGAGEKRRCCAFCSSADSKITREHLWPDWLRGIVDASLAERRSYRYATQDTYSDVGHTVEGQPLFSRTVSGVCVECNTGWMHGLETDAKRTLSGLLVGATGVLDEEAQVILAMWGALKGHVGQVGFRNSAAVPASHRRELMYWCAQGQPPPLTSVYAGRTRWSAGGAGPGFFRLNEVDRRTDDSSRLGYLMTFSALDIVVATVRSRDTDERWDFDFPAPVAASFAQIWPPQASLSWPPGPALDDRAILIAAGGPQALGADT